MFEPCIQPAKRLEGRQIREAHSTHHCRLLDANLGFELPGKARGRFGYSADGAARTLPVSIGYDPEADGGGYVVNGQLERAAPRGLSLIARDHFGSRDCLEGSSWCTEGPYADVRYDEGAKKSVKLGVRQKLGFTQTVGC